MVDLPFFVGGVGRERRGGGEGGRESKGKRRTQGLFVSSFQSFSKTLVIGVGVENRQKLERTDRYWRGPSIGKSEILSRDEKGPFNLTTVPLAQSLSNID